MKKTTKKKSYAGPVPFDVFGNQLLTNYGVEYWLEPTQIVQDKILIELGYPSVKKESFFSIKELNIEIFSQLKPQFDTNAWNNSWYNNPANNPAKYIAKCKQVVLKDNYLFKDTLSYKGCYKNGGTICFRWESAEGRSYTMFAKEFDRIFDKISNGKLTGDFTFGKHGGKFGIILDL